MKFTAKQLILASVATLLMAAPASAHRAWILPSTFTLSGDEQVITLDAAVSNDLFYPNHRPFNLDDISVTAPDGSNVDISNAASGEIRSVFDVKLDQQGTYKIGSGGSGGSGYFAGWEEDGQHKRWRGTADELVSEGIADKPGVRLSKNARRIETFVTLGAPTDTVFTPTGEGLELQPITHPNDAYAGEEITFGLLLDSKPATGIEVEIVRGDDRYRDEVDSIKVTTSEDGTISFTPDEPGPYWLSAETEGKAALNGEEIDSRMSYVMTFEVLSF